MCDLSGLLEGAGYNDMFEERTPQEVMLCGPCHAARYPGSGKMFCWVNPRSMGPGGMMLRFWSPTRPVGPTHLISETPLGQARACVGGLKPSAEELSGKLLDHPWDAVVNVE